MSLRKIALLSAFIAAPVLSEPLTIYTGRHYEADRKLYELFTEKTGIETNVVEGKDDALLQRLKSTKDKADVLITVDAGRLHKAKIENLFQCEKQPELEKVIPAELSDKDGCWYGFAKRSRVIVYNKTKGYPEGLESYESMAMPLFKNSICVRSSNNIYNQSLVASLLARHGQQTTLELIKGWVANFARKPRGNDRDQIAAVLNNECRLGIVNSYYIPRFSKKELKNLGVIFPNQMGRGAHINVSGAGIVKGTDQPKEARQFLAFLAEPEAQKMFAEGNNEYPMLSTVATPESLKIYGEFKGDDLDADTLGSLNRDAVKIMDIAGWR